MYLKVYKIKINKNCKKKLFNWYLTDFFYF